MIKCEKVVCTGNINICCWSCPCSPNCNDKCKDEPSECGYSETAVVDDIFGVRAV